MTIMTEGIKDIEQTPAVRKMMWEVISESVLGILGSTGVIIPIGDTNHESAGRTTVTTTGGETTVFTYSEAVTAFDKPPLF